MCCLCWPVYWIIVDRTGVEIPLDVILFFLGYGAVFLCSSAGGGRKWPRLRGWLTFGGAVERAVLCIHVALRSDYAPPLPLFLSLLLYTCILLYISSLIYM